MAKRPDWQQRQREVKAKWLKRPAVMERKSELGREFIARFGGVPNAVKFTKESTLGEKNNRWRGGITPANQVARHSLEYKAWIKAVMVRDDYTCQICKERGGYLHTHHLKGFAKFPELRHEVTNGMTLCKDCHVQIVHRGSWSNEPLTLEQIREIQNCPVTIDWAA